MRWQARLPCWNRKQAMSASSLRKTFSDMPLDGSRIGELLTLMGNSVYIGGDVIRGVAVASLWHFRDS